MAELELILKVWLEEFIEEPLRELVGYLRMNGINTTCSCGHNTDIEVSDYYGEIYSLWTLLFTFHAKRWVLTASGFEDHTFCIECSTKPPSGLQVALITLTWPKEQSEFLNAEIVKTKYLLEHPGECSMTSEILNFRLNRYLQIFRSKNL